jgi:hypothetical protein
MGIMKYHKSELVEAVQYTGENDDELRELAGERLERLEKTEKAPDSVAVIFKYTWCVIQKGDYLVKSGDGYITGRDRLRFEELYSPVALVNGETDTEAPRITEEYLERATNEIEGLALDSYEQGYQDGKDNLPVFDDGLRADIGQKIMDILGGAKE